MDPIERAVQTTCSDDGESDLVIAESPETDIESKRVANFSSSVLVESSDVQFNHVEERNYDCKHCTHRCSSLADLHSHMNVHSVAKPFWCLLCEYKCRNKANLKSHQRSHSNVRPHACHYCPYKSKTRVNLKNHLRKHTGEKPYSCTVCPYKCSTQGSLNVHVRVHTGEKPYFCSECDYKSATSGALKSHYKVHSGETPYKCPECPKSFTKLGQLKTHRNSHTADRTYRCPSCSFRSDVPEDISEHISHHDNIRSSGINNGLNQFRKEEETSDSSSDKSHPVSDSGAPTAARSLTRGLTQNQEESVPPGRYRLSSTISPGDLSCHQSSDEPSALRSSLWNQLISSTTHSGPPLESQLESSSLRVMTPLSEHPRWPTVFAGTSFRDQESSTVRPMASVKYKCESILLRSTSPLSQPPDQSKSSTVHPRSSLRYWPASPLFCAKSPLSKRAGSLPMYGRSSFGPGSSTMHPMSSPGRSESPTLRGASSLNNHPYFAASQSKSSFSDQPRFSFRDHPGSSTERLNAPSSRPASPLSNHQSPTSSPSSSPFSCIFCDRLFSDMNILKDHLAAHSDQPKLGVTWPKFSVPFSFLDGFFPPNHLQDIYWNETGMPSRFNGFFSMFFGNYL